MIKSATRSSTPLRTAAGFSMVELVVSICVMLVLTALAIPSLMRSLHAYQLNSAAASVSDMLKFTRFEAVRRNKQINLQFTQSGLNWIVWTDSFAVGNAGTIDKLDKRQLIAGYATLLPMPGSAPPIPLNGTTPTPLSGSNSSVTFDARGAVRQSIGGQLSSSAYVFYIGHANDPNDLGSGYRAVVLLLSGSTQIWTWNDQTGLWRRTG